MNVADSTLLEKRRVDEVSAAVTCRLAIDLRHAATVQPETNVKGLSRDATAHWHQHKTRGNVFVD